jgi:isoleucyl-tRNA synthetase
MTCIGSRAELGELAGRDLSALDPHRPFIDEVTFPCPHCDNTATRAPEVIDAWFDSGAMPFAGIGYPYVEGSEELFAKSYPAQFICEAIDQTRGWFYTLMAIGTTVFDRSSYENVVCLGHIMSEDGRKMSKHLGNIIEPIPFLEKHGADALRWFMLCSGSPWSPRRVGDAPVEEIVRKVLLTYWNTASFFTLYASTSQWDPEAARPVAERPVLDRWLLAELEYVAASVDEALENFDTAGAGRTLAQFIDDVSNWYVRRGRARFWGGDADALATLHECLNVLTRLLAPFVPFIAEQVWRGAVLPGAPALPESVHLAAWPAPAPERVDEQLRADMELVRQLVEAGRAVRKSTNLRIRQPLQRVLVGVPGGRTLPDELVAEVADELNVREVIPLAEAGEVIEISVKPNFRELGKRFGPRTQHVARAVADADSEALARALKAHGRTGVFLDGEEVTVTLEDVILTEIPRSGWAVASQQELTLALDTTVTQELRLAGLAREVIRLVQNARKEAGFEVTDRIALVWSAEGETAEALRLHEREIADAVLALEISEALPGSPLDGLETGVVTDLELGVQIAARRVA